MDKYECLKKYFGYNTFRSNQDEIIDSILNKTDTIGVLATGSGKSICFQIPALIFPGITIVVSPLISLQQDQVRELDNAKIPSIYLNSTIDKNKLASLYKNIRNGLYKIIYISPEGLINKEFQKSIENLLISMLVIDEAHCISLWGHDFRLSYNNITYIIKKLKNKPLLCAFTATANERTINDIIVSTMMNEPKIIYSSFDRCNLIYFIIKVKDKKIWLLNFLKDNNLCVIIYCLTIKMVMEVYKFLDNHNYSVTYYHGTLEPVIKEKNQNDFIKSNKRIMVATNAFGMGINKRDVRYVINYNMPSSIEDFSQQTGRSSRDLKKGFCYLLSDSEDIRINEYFIRKTACYNIPKDKLDKLIDIKKDRLNKMIKLSLNKSCVRKSLVGYFNEEIDDYCGACSFCLNNFKVKEVTYLIHKLLDDCILDNIYSLDIFKAENELKNKYILKQFIDLLVFNSYIKICGENFYKIKDISTHPHYILVLKKKSYCDDNVSLRSCLIRLRSEIKVAEHSIIYTVFSNKTINDLVRIKPKNYESLMKCFGLKEKKINKYGNLLINVVEKFTF